MNPLTFDVAIPVFSLKTQLFLRRIKYPDEIKSINDINLFEI